MDCSYYNGYLPANYHPSDNFLARSMSNRSFDGNFTNGEAAPAVTGGINTILEYDISNMSTFISWCSFSILKQSRIPSYDFEQSIKSVLFATRLPKSTIIIALEYINQRYSSYAAANLTNDDIFVKIITSFILANKFNDDNTFTNKSWFGATGLSLTLLNSSEIDWLNSINWNLNVVKFEVNITTLLSCWDTWLVKYGKGLGPASPYSPSMNYSYEKNQENYNYHDNYNYIPPQHYLPPPQHYQPLPPYPGSVILPYPTYQSSTPYNYYYPSPLSPMGDIYQEKYYGYGYGQTMC